MSQDGRDPQQQGQPQADANGSLLLECPLCYRIFMQNRVGSAF